MVDIYPPAALTASLEQKPKVEYNQGSVRYFYCWSENISIVDSLDRPRSACKDISTR